MPCKFCRFVPKGASRKGPKVPQPSSSSGDIEIVTSDSSTQTESPEMKDAFVEAEEAVVITIGVGRCFILGGPHQFRPVAV